MRFGAMAPIGCIGFHDNLTRSSARFFRNLKLATAPSLGRCAQFTETFYYDKPIVSTLAL